MRIPPEWLAGLLSHLDGAALRVALALASMADDAAAVTASVADVGRRAGVCERQARRALRALERVGVVVAAATPGGVWSFRIVTSGAASDNIEKVQRVGFRAAAGSENRQSVSSMPAAALSGGGASAGGGRTFVSGGTLVSPPPRGPLISPPVPPPLTPPASKQASKAAAVPACLPAVSRWDHGAERIGTAPPSGDELAAKLCGVDVLLSPMRWDSVGSEIGARELIERHGREFVAAQLALVLERKRIEGKRLGASLKPSCGYLLAACRGDWAGFNAPAAVEARQAAAARERAKAERLAAAQTAAAAAETAAAAAERAEAEARAFVSGWASSADPERVREAVEGVLSRCSSLVRGTVMRAAKAAGGDGAAQVRAAALHRSIVEAVAASVRAASGRRVVPVEEV